ncbi:MAG: hypothetical protein IID18_01840 [Nitrospinae bacterium]|nr:hypothetical protein [Nitrospinota bacterium]
MPITYPLAMPTNRKPAGVRFTPFSVVGVSRSPFSLAQQVQEFDGQMWQAEVDLPKMFRNQAEEWIAFFLKLNGMRGTFLLGDPAGTLPRGVGTGTPLVKGAGQAARQDQLITDGWTISTTGILKAGDWLQIGTGSSSHLHKVLDDADSDASGDATLTLWPKLREIPNDNETLSVNDAKGVFRLTTNEMPWELEAPERYQLSFGCHEVL